MFSLSWRFSSLSNVGCSRSLHWLPMLRSVLPHLFVFGFALLLSFVNFQTSFLLDPPTGLPMPRSVLSHLSFVRASVPSGLRWNCFRCGFTSGSCYRCTLYMVLFGWVCFASGITNPLLRSWSRLAFFAKNTTCCHASRPLHCRGLLCPASSACMRFPLLCCLGLCSTWELVSLGFARSVYSHVFI